MGDCEPHENAVNKCKPPKNPPRDADCPMVGNLDLSIQMAHDLYKDMKASKTAHELCMEDCKERFPKLDER